MCAHEAKTLDPVRSQEHTLSAHFSPSKLGSDLQSCTKMSQNTPFLMISTKKGGYERVLLNKTIFCKAVKLAFVHSSLLHNRPPFKDALLFRK